jgi:hypothetical protein
VPPLGVTYETELETATGVLTNDEVGTTMVDPDSVTTGALHDGAAV